MGAIPMRLVSPLASVVLAAFLAAPLAQADDPSKVDPAKRDETFAPPANTVAPEKRELPRAEVVQERRAPVPDKVEKKPSAMGDRRAAIDLSETREKTVIDKKMGPKPEVQPRDLNRWNQEKAKVQPQEVALLRSLGAIDVIAKPFDPMTLAQTVRQIWERSKLA